LGSEGVELSFKDRGRVLSAEVEMGEKEEV